MNEMRKFAYLRSPKTASGTLTSAVKIVTGKNGKQWHAVNKLEPGCKGIHALISGSLTAADVPNRLRVASVRDPMHRAVSMYRYYVVADKSQWAYESRTFPDWMAELQELWLDPAFVAKGKPEVRPFSFVKPHLCEVIIDTADIESGWERFLQASGLDPKGYQLKHHHQSPGGTPWQDEYDGESRRIVETLYEEDLAFYANHRVL